MSKTQTYPIGTAGTPWGDAEKTAWRASQSAKRSYATDVLSRIETLRSRYEILEYGRLDSGTKQYPLLAVKSLGWRDDKPIVLVTGGVHGYETSGVHGALGFLEQHAAAYEDRVNLLVAPCVSPWAYEMIQRWNMQAIDPNRSFVENSQAAESAALRELVLPLNAKVLVHIDLHETTDTDESEFRPALAARDGIAYVPGEIPDGFYLVDDSEQPQTEFQSAIIAAVAKVTHIAPADDKGQLIGSDQVAPGVIQYPLKKLGLCAGVTDAPFKTTTEVYPDSPRTNSEECNIAQCAAVCAAIDYALAHQPA